MNVLILDRKETFVKLVGRISEDDNYTFVTNIDFQKIDTYLLSIDLVLSISYDNQSYNYVIQESKNKGILTGLLIDGPLEWSNSFINNTLRKNNIDKLYQPIIHDLVYCISNSQLEYLKFVNSEKQFFTYKNNRIVLNSNIEKLDTNIDFLVTTANTSYFNKEEQYRLYKILENLINYLEQSNYSYETRFFDNEFKKLTKKNNISDSIEEHINSAKCIICTPSSVILSAMSKNKPVAQLIYRDSPLYYQSGWMIYSDDFFNETLASMYQKDSDRMKYQSFEVIKNISLNIIDLKKIQLLNQQEEKPFNYSECVFALNTLKAILDSKWNFNLKYYVKKIIGLTK